MLLRIIEEEIDVLLMEQVAPPADPASLPPPTDPTGTPPASPDAGEEKEDNSEDKTEEINKKIKELSGKDKQDIRKNLISMLQNEKRDDALKILGKIKDRVAEEEMDVDVSINLQDVVDDLVQQFPELEEEVDKATLEQGEEEEETPTEGPEATGTPPAPPGQAPAPPAPPAAPAAPLKESRVQMLSKEYLKYRSLYLRAGGKL